MLAQAGAVTGPVGSAVVLVPAQDPAPPPGKGPEFGNASPVGLVVVLVLLVATVVLIRSMTKRIRRLPESFDPEEERPDTASSDAPGPDDAPDVPDTPSGMSDGARAGGADRARSDAEPSDSVASDPAPSGRSARDVEPDPGRG